MATWKTPEKPQNCPVGDPGTTPAASRPHPFPAEKTEVFREGAPDGTWSMVWIKKLLTR